MTDPSEEMLTPAWLFPHGPGPRTDPIGMDYIIRELEPVLRTRLVAARMETVAATYRNIAEAYRSIGDGAAKAAEIVNAGVHQ